MIEHQGHATLSTAYDGDVTITFPVGAQLTGYRLRDIRIRLSAAEFVDPHVRAWLLEVVLPRRASVDEAVCIELG
ncbi:MAG TPA: hypothetical protein VFX38_05360 [Gammaproteobacteria bacterium]|nr:hypothetical protein [Gammaproteobacteria bacterium]